MHKNENRILSGAAQTKRFGMAMITPTVIVLLILTAYPLIFTFYYSLTDYNLLKVKYNHQLPVRIKNGIRYVRNRHSDRNRIVLQLRDRLGNQMFIYALYMKLKSMGRDVTIDDTSMIAECENGRVFDNTDLIRTFGITYDRASDHQIEALRDTGTHKSDRLRRRLLGAQGIICTESKDFAYDETLLKTRKGYFEGYFQNTRYFSDIESEIRKAFQFHAGCRASGGGRCLHRPREIPCW